MQEVRWAAVMLLAGTLAVRADNTGTDSFYICDLYVLKALSAEQIEAISGKTLSLDSLNKTYIRNELSYRYLVTDCTVVRAIEDFVQRNGIGGIKPLINPKG